MPSCIDGMGGFSMILMKHLFSLLTLLTSAAGLCAQQPPSSDLESRLAILSGEYISSDGSYVSHSEMPCQVVWQGDSVVWFKNLFPVNLFTSGQDAWVKGTVSNHIRILIHPQRCYDYPVEYISETGEAQTMTYPISVGGVTVADDGSFTVGDYEMVNDPLTGTIHATSASKLLGAYVAADNVPSMPEMAGLYDEVRNVTVEEIGDQIITLPEGAIASPYFYSYYDYALGASRTSLVHIYIDHPANKGYVQGLCPDVPDGWVCGNLNDKGSITLESGQLQGVTTQHVIYFAGCKASDSGYTIQNLTLVHNDDSYVVADGYYVAECTPSGFGINMFGSLSLSPFVSDVTPSDPFSLTLQEMDGEEYFYFALYPKGTDGTPMIRDSLGYQLFFDGDTEPYVFDPADYRNFSEPTTTVPVLYDDALWGNIVYRDDYAMMGIDISLIRIVEDLYQQIGVRLVYTWEGVSRTSNIVWLDREAGISNVANEVQAPERYFDLVGRPLAAPHGFCIRQVGGHSAVLCR